MALTHSPGNCQDWRHGMESGKSTGILSSGMPPTTCPYCPSRPISQRTGTTDLGYGLFRCSVCRRKFNERTGTPFNHLEFPTDMVFQVVCSAWGPSAPRNVSVRHSMKFGNTFVRVADGSSLSPSLVKGSCLLLECNRCKPAFWPASK